MIGDGVEMTESEAVAGKTAPRLHSRLLRDERWAEQALGFPNHVTGEGCSTALKVFGSGNSSLPFRLDV